MKDYILFIDTETSGAPRKIGTPTSQTEKWPYILQVAWAIYTKQGNHVATQNFYIKHEHEIPIDKESFKLHGITHQMLEEKGVARKYAFQKLSSDLEKYRPLLVGHYLLFDEKMLEVGFNRAGLSKNFLGLPKFCTMRSTRFEDKFRANSTFLRLNELYYSLFRKDFDGQHDALSDALATKECFFELIRKGKVTDVCIEDQQEYFEPVEPRPFSRALILSFSIFALFIFAFWACK
ncbi:3'-5' exonuclease [Flammeovirgaceae bacterium SG7u.111]|nr:3'-5' exonuclease [Flammeovirgaceae bacterium SG7u.132]WPO38012.1 3'-5' exonuclease [Flammeovirgaceae bacterium SG7u.111]